MVNCLCRVSFTMASAVSANEDWITVTLRSVSKATIFASVSSGEMLLPVQPWQGSVETKMTSTCA
jgi:hypothetical protein